MKRKRRHLTAEFKARVAAEALKGEKSILQIAQENDIAPTQVSTWKKELEDHMPSIFERKIGSLRSMPLSAMALTMNSTLLGGYGSDGGLFSNSSN